jgi:hypothetical protein
MYCKKKKDLTNNNRYGIVGLERKKLCQKKVRQTSMLYVIVVKVQSSITLGYFLDRVVGIMKIKMYAKNVTKKNG